MDTDTCVARVRAAARGRRGARRRGGCGGGPWDWRAAAAGGGVPRRSCEASI